MKGNGKNCLIVKRFFNGLIATNGIIIKSNAKYTTFQIVTAPEKICFTYFSGSQIDSTSPGKGVSAITRLLQSLQEKV